MSSGRSASPGRRKLQRIPSVPPPSRARSGRSTGARAATFSHTASLSGEAAAGSALLARLGIAEVASPGAFLETLHLLHEGGPLAGNAVVSVSCSGGEAGLMADLTEASELDLRPFGLDVPAERVVTFALGRVE